MKKTQGTASMLLAIAVLFLAAAIPPAAFAQQQLAPGQVTVSSTVMTGEQSIRVSYNPPVTSLWCVVMGSKNSTGASLPYCSGSNGGDITISNFRRSDGLWFWVAGIYDLEGFLPFNGQFSFSAFTTQIQITTVPSILGSQWTNLEGAARLRSVIALNGVGMVDIILPPDAQLWPSAPTGTLLQINQRSHAVSVQTVSDARTGFTIQPPASAQVGDTISIWGVSNFDVGVGEAASKWFYQSAYVVGPATTTVTPPVTAGCVATFMPPDFILVPGTTIQRPTRGADGVFEYPVSKRSDGLGYNAPTIDFVFGYPQNTLLSVKDTKLTITYPDGVSDPRPYGVNQITNSDGTQPRNPAAEGLSLRATPDPAGLVSHMRFTGSVSSGPVGCSSVDSGSIPIRIVLVP